MFQYPFFYLATLLTKARNAHGDNSGKLCFKQLHVTVFIYKLTNVHKKFNSIFDIIVKLFGFLRLAFLEHSGPVVLILISSPLHKNYHTSSIHVSVLIKQKLS